MSILSRLASEMGRRDEVPNQVLAEEIVAAGKTEAIAELVKNLGHKSMAIQNDCIKVLYEVGEQQPALIAGHLDSFLALLTHKNNRLQWGGMAALNCIAAVEPDRIHDHLGQIMAAAEAGSVITRDHAVNILIKLAAERENADQALNLLAEQMQKCPTNQLPMYAERALPVIRGEGKSTFAAILNLRLPEIDKASKQKRIEKIIKRLADAQP